MRHAAAADRYHYISNSKPPLLSFEVKMPRYPGVENCRERDQPNLLHLLLPAAREDKKAVALDFGRHDSLRARFPLISVLRCFQ